MTPEQIAELEAGRRCNDAQCQLIGFHTKDCQIRTLRATIYEKQEHIAGLALRLDSNDDVIRTLRAQVEERDRRIAGLSKSPACHCAYCDPANWPDTNGWKCQAAQTIATLQAQLAEARADGERRYETGKIAAFSRARTIVEAHRFHGEFAHASYGRYGCVEAITRELLKEHIDQSPISDAARGKAGA